MAWVCRHGTRQDFNNCHWLRPQAGGWQPLFCHHENTGHEDTIFFGVLGLGYSRQPRGWDGFTHNCVKYLLWAFTGLIYEWLTIWGITGWNILGRTEESMNRARLQTLLLHWLLLSRGIWGLTQFGAHLVMPGFQSCGCTHTSLHHVELEKDCSKNNHWGIFNLIARLWLIHETESLCDKTQYNNGEKFMFDL